MFIYMYMFITLRQYITISGRVQEGVSGAYIYIAYISS